MNQIDITFNVFSDTPKGKDPDSHSPTLRKYHQILWSKPLPDGRMFELDLNSDQFVYSCNFFSISAVGISFRSFVKGWNITSYENWPTYLANTVTPLS